MLRIEIIKFIFYLSIVIAIEFFHASIKYNISYSIKVGLELMKCIIGGLECTYDIHTVCRASTVGYRCNLLI